MLAGRFPIASASHTSLKPANSGAPSFTSGGLLGSEVFWTAGIKMAWNLFLGRSGEDQAVRFLQQLGYRIVERNHRNQIGELDLIAKFRGRIIFVEVKTRSSRQAGDPVEAVGLTKQRQIVRTALAYLHARNLLDAPVRFDVVTVLQPQPVAEAVITHYPGAFEPDWPGQFFC